MSAGEFYSEVVDPDEIELEEKQELSHCIDEWLAESRPPRYEVGDKQWQDVVIEKVRDELLAEPAEDVALEAARRRVYGREQQATRRANDFLRLIFIDGKLPIGWGHGEEWKLLQSGLLRMPISVGKRRIRLGESSDRDLEDWTKARREQRDKEDISREQAAQGAEILITWMRQHNVQRLQDLRLP